jgi:hypothetical protein
VDTGSQVCNLAWSRSVNELVSTHGYSQNQITVWKYPALAPIGVWLGGWWCGWRLALLCQVMARFGKISKSNDTPWAMIAVLIFRQ